MLFSLQKLSNTFISYLTFELCILILAILVIQLPQYAPVFTNCLKFLQNVFLHSSKLQFPSMKLSVLHYHMIVIKLCPCFCNTQ